MLQSEPMVTLSEILNKLKTRGFDDEFVMNNEGLLTSERTQKKYHPEDLLIFRTFRFEADTDPDDNAILYMVEDKDGDIGYILDTYGAYRSHDGAAFDDFLKRIPTEDRNDEELFPEE